MKISHLISVLAVGILLASCGQPTPGPKGDKGDKGEQGQRGAPGQAGPAGPAGAAGPAGQAGPAGAAGPKGDKGDKGDRGVAGAAGPAGPVGPAASPLRVIRMENCPGGACNFTCNENELLVSVTCVTGQLILTTPNGGQCGNSSGLIAACMRK